MPRRDPHPNYKKIYAVVRRIPKGRVATYGQVADPAGLPDHARQVGYALHALRDDDPVPWQRVVNAKGEISPRAHSNWHKLQREMLESEGIVFELTGCIDLARFRWRPRSKPRKKSRH